MSPQNNQGDLWLVENQPNFRFSLRCSEKLHESQSKFQKVEVYQSIDFGRVMLLDGCIMLTERDEFVYHEMISHVPVCHHLDPKKVLVIGGGDGGTVRELVRHQSIEQIVLCEIDGAVIDCAKEYFPAVASELCNDRVEVIVGDGIDFVVRSKEKYDIVIVDSTDPIGPGVGLFTENFYKNVSGILNKGGILVAQTESLWEQGDIVQKIRNNIRAGFDEVESYCGFIPTYPFGGWTWTIASQAEFNLNLDRFKSISSELHFLNEQNLTNVFNLPQFYKRTLATTGK